MYALKLNLQSTCNRLTIFSSHTIFMSYEELFDCKVYKFNLLDKYSETKWKYGPLEDIYDWLQWGSQHKIISVTQVFIIISFWIFTKFFKWIGACFSSFILCLIFFPLKMTYEKGTYSLIFLAMMKPFKDWRTFKTSLIPTH